MKRGGCLHRGICLFLVLTFGSVAAQLDDENAILGVYMNSGMLQGERATMDELIKQTGQDSSAQMEMGSLSVQPFSSIEAISKANLTGVLTVTTCQELQSMAPEINADGKLHIAITEAGCMRLRSPSTMTVPLVTGENEIVQLIADLREKNTLVWDDIVIVHDNSIASFVLDEVVRLLTLPTDRAAHTSVLMIDISKEETTSMKLGAIFNELGPRPGEPKERQFLAIVSKNQVETVQNIANTMELMGPKYQWLYMISDSHSLNYDMITFLENMKDGDNMAFAYNMSELNPTSDCKNGLNCYLATLIRQYALEYSRELKKEQELYLQVSEEEWDEIKPSLQARAENIVTALKVQQETIPSCSICTKWGMEAGEVRAVDRIELLRVAEWLPATGLTLFDDIFPHITGGFRQRTIIITSVNYPPWQIIQKDGTYSGLIFDMVKTLGDRLNFSFVVREPSDGQWGTRLPNGDWTGMIKMIQNKEVLFGAAAFTVSSERLKVVNFTTTIDLQPYAYLIARPKELSRVLIFIKPFTNRMWIFIGITVLLMGPILFVINRFSPYYEFHGLDDGLGLFKLDNCAWYVYGAILQQGGTKLPLANSGRLVIGTWWIFVTVVVTTYSGNLVAFLTFPQIENAVSTLDDLLEAKNDMTWGYTAGTVLEEYFETAEGKFKDVGDLAERHQTQDGALFNRVRYTPHALLEWKTNLLFKMKEEFLKTDTCDFSLGREEFYFESVAMPVPRDSPYIEIFNNEIKRMLLAGLTEKWKQDYWPKKDKCSTTAYGGSGETRTVSILDMQGSFFILLIGFLLALIILLIECVLQRNIKSLPSTPSSTRTLVKSFVA